MLYKGFADHWFKRLQKIIGLFEEKDFKLYFFTNAHFVVYSAV